MFVFVHELRVCMCVRACVRACLKDVREKKRGHET